MKNKELVESTKPDKPVIMEQVNIPPDTQFSTDKN
jgi:hypothetical protein